MAAALELGDDREGGALERATLERAAPLSRIHHVGTAVADIEKAGRRLVERLGYEVVSPVIHDPAQTAYIQFLRLPEDTVCLELVSPDGPASKLDNAVRKGGGLNHICYAAAHLDAACAWLASRGFVLIQPPTPAVAFPHRRIAWLMGTDRVPIELVEPGPPGEI